MSYNYVQSLITIMMKTSVKFHVKVASLLMMKMKIPSEKLYSTENKKVLEVTEVFQQSRRRETQRSNKQALGKEV